MRRARGAVLPALVALVVLLSGCSGVGSGGTGAQSSTMTPVEVPDVTPAPTPTGDADRWLAPGLTDRGVEGAWLLGRAHEAVLANTSYTSRTVETTRYANGTVRGRIRTTVRATPGAFTTVSIPTGTHARAYPFPDAERVEVYGVDGRLHFAVTDADGTWYFSFDRADAGVPSLYALLSSVETHTAGTVARNGTTLYRVRATGLADTRRFAVAVGVAANGYEASAVGNVSLRALVDSRGLVREYELDYTLRRDGPDLRVTRRVRYTDLGETSVQRPSWYDEATEDG